MSNSIIEAQEELKSQQEDDILFNCLMIGEIKLSDYLDIKKEKINFVRGNLEKTI